MTLTGLSLKSRKALTALFNQVSAPPPLEKIKHNPVTAALNYLIDLAASGLGFSKRKPYVSLFKNLAAA